MHRRSSASVPASGQCLPEGPTSSRKPRGYSNLQHSIPCLKIPYTGIMPNSFPKCFHLHCLTLEQHWLTDEEQYLEVRPVQRA